MMDTETRRHPDVFTAEEAVAYLHLDRESVGTLETLRQSHSLRSFRIGNATMYHRAQLDELVGRMAGTNATTPRQRRGGSVEDAIRSTLRGK